MSEPFVGEIRMFAGNFAPRGWAFCDGQLLAVSQNDALFSLLGTIFGLPDVRGRIPLHAGHGPGLSERRLGSKGGAEKVTLTVNQMPSHGHPMQASSEGATTANPQGEVLAETLTDRVYRPDSADTNMASSSVTNTGGSRSHTNLMPFLCVNFIIALVGIYPSRH